MQKPPAETSTVKEANWWSVTLNRRCRRGLERLVFTVEAVRAGHRLGRLPYG
jgi:hypothetical protein